jgi:gluconate 5-dehydrogenase
MTDTRSRELEGRIALVTGGAQGLGACIARQFAAAGARVVIADLDAPGGQALAAELPGASFVRLDVTRESDWLEALAAIERSPGPLDILVNNAGIQRRGPLDKFTDADWHALVAHNLDSVFFVGRAVARHMIPRGRGKIINIGSVQCELARPTIAPYTATKGAVRNLTRGMCADWAGHGLQINAICPGYFDTPLNKALVENSEFDSWLRKRTPAGRWGRLEDLHGAAVFLASRASDFVNGQMLYVDGGITAVI